MAIESELAFKRNPQFTAIFLTLSPMIRCSIELGWIQPKEGRKRGELVRMVQDQSLILYSFEGFLDSSTSSCRSRTSLGLNQKGCLARTWKTSKNNSPEACSCLRISVPGKPWKTKPATRAISRNCSGHFAQVHASDQFIGQADRRKQRLPFLDSDVPVGIRHR